MMKFLTNFLIGFVALCVVIVAVLWAVYYFYEPSPVPTRVVDRLCEYVRNEQKMECVAVLADEALMKPGAVVDVQGPGAGPDVVPLPRADLFGPACQVPGIDLTAFQKAMMRPSQISIPHFTYDVNRALAIGTDVEVPQFRDFSFKAGPRWRDVAKIEMTNDEAWVLNLDELGALDFYRSCRIVKECTDYVRTAKYRVVGTAIVAKGLSYKVFDEKGRFISLQTATRSETFTASVGGTTDIRATTDATLKAAGPRVVGVRLMPADVFMGDQICEERAQLQPPRAKVEVSVEGKGGKGSIVPKTRATEALGEPVQIAAQGAERNECDDGAGRISRASAEARVDPDGPGAVKFAYNLAAEGGRYETAAQCQGGVAIDKGTSETTAIATADMTATIFILVRTRSAPKLRLGYSNMPPGAAIRVLNSSNQRLQVVRTGFSSGEVIRRRENMPDTVSGSGSEVFEPDGPGLYRVETQLRLSETVSGTAKEPNASVASVRVTLD